MIPLAGVGAAAAMARQEEELKRYLIVCEYLQIDPLKIHDIKFIHERIDIVLSQWSSDEDPKSFEMLLSALSIFITEMGLMKDPGTNPLLKLRNAPKERGSHAFKAEGLYVRPIRNNTKFYADYSAMRMEEGKLAIDPSTVNEVYEKKGLTQNNRDNYDGRFPKWSN